MVRAVLAALPAPGPCFALGLEDGEVIGTSVLVASGAFRGGIRSRQPLVRSDGLLSSDGEVLGET